MGNVKDRDLGYKQIIEDLRRLASKEIKVGVQSGDMADDGFSMARLAAVHEFGFDIDIEAGSVTQYRSVGKDGNFKHGGKLRKRKLKSTNFAQTFARKAHTIHIPERSFIRSAFDENKKEIWKLADDVGNRVSEMKLDPMQGLRIIGEEMESKIKEKIKHGPFTPNAPSTVRKKKSDQPLIDTGRLRNSIRYEVK